MAEKSKNSELLEEYSNYILPVLNFKDTVITKGKGSYVWDADGNKILDLNSGQFCAILGHSNPIVSQELNIIANKLQDTDTSTLSDDVLFAAKKMHDICEGMSGRTLFLSTGAEANECCLRYAKHLKEKNGIVAFDLGYHGLTHGTAGYSMSRSRIRPVLPHSYVVPAPLSFYGDDLTEKQIDEYVEEFEKVVSQNVDNIAAAIFEPIISGGGLYFPPKYYFKRVRELCNKYGIFLIFDECQTGFGRTGSWFYYQQLETVPDFLVCAKAMGVGFPVSCVVANGNTVTNDLFVMQHYSSHQNEPFAARLVSLLIDTINSQSLLESNITKGNYLLNRLIELSTEYNIIKKPRGIGLMTGFNLYREGLSNYKQLGEEFCSKVLEHGVMLQHCNNGRTIRFLPNYLIEKTDIDYLIEKLNKLIKENY
ncbi:MAG: aspartate aminotransferase family protein [Ignavibacteria bacterium]|jgi:4-aminobutyrate aminotransferase-like enzyme